MASSFAAYASQFINRQTGVQSTSSENQPIFFSFTTDNSRPASPVDEEEYDLDDPHLAGGSTSRGFLAVDEEDTPYLRLDNVQEAQQPGPSKRPHSPALSSSEGGWLAHQGYGQREDEDEDEELAAEMAEENSDSDDQELPSGLIASGLQTKGKAKVNALPNLTVSASHLTESLLPSQDAFNLPDPRLIGRRKGIKYNDALWTTLWLTGVCICYISAVILLFTTRSTSPPTSVSSPSPYPTLLHTIPLLVPLIILSAIASYLHILFLRIWLRPVVWLSALGTPMLLFVCSVWAWVGSFVDEGEPNETWGETTGLRLFSLLPLTLSLILAYRLYTLFSSLPRLSAQITQTELILSLTTRILAENPFLLGLSPVLLFAMLVGSVPFGTVVGRLLLVGKWSRGSGSTSEYHIKWGAELGIVLAIGVWLWSWGVARGILRVVSAGVIGGWYFGVPWVESTDDEEAAPGRFNPPLNPPLNPPSNPNPDLDAELSPPPMFANFTTPSMPPLVLPSSLSPSSPQTHILHAAFHRATHTSLGSICLSALILTSIRLLTILTIFLTNLPEYIFTAYSTVLRVLSIWLPPPVVFFARNVSGVIAGPIMMQVWQVIRGGFLWALRIMVRYLEGLTDTMSRYVLIYVGMTGREWAGASRKVGALMRGGAGRKALSPPPLPTLLTLTPLTLTLPFSLVTYLFVAHTLSAPHQALVSAMVAALTTGLVGVFCVGVVRDVGDGLWVAWCVDKDAGLSENHHPGQGSNRRDRSETQGLIGLEGRRELVVQAFEYSLRARREVKQAAAARAGAERSGQRPGPSQPQPYNYQQQPARSHTPAPPPTRTRYEEYPTHFSTASVSLPSNSHIGVAQSQLDAYPGSPQSQQSGLSTPESIDVKPLSPNERQRFLEAQNQYNHPPPQAHDDTDVDPFALELDPDPDPFVRDSTASVTALNLEGGSRTVHPVRPQDLDGDRRPVAGHSRRASGKLSEPGSEGGMSSGSGSRTGVHGEEGEGSGSGSAFFPGSGIFG